MNAVRASHTADQLTMREELQVGKIARRNFRAGPLCGIPIPDFLVSAQALLRQAEHERVKCGHKHALIRERVSSTLAESHL